jgi:hypothetical protein
VVALSLHAAVFAEDNDCRKHFAVLSYKYILNQKLKTDLFGNAGDILQLNKNAEFCSVEIFY